MNKISNDVRTKADLKWNFSADLIKVALIPDFSTIDTSVCAVVLTIINVRKKAEKRWFFVNLQIFPTIDRFVIGAERENTGSRNRRKQQLSSDVGVRFR